MSSTPEIWETMRVFDDVQAERDVQRGRWTNAKDDTNTPMQWTTYLGAYFGYVAQAVFTWRTKATEEARLRYEPAEESALYTALIKLAATAVAWAEAINRRKERSRAARS